MLADQGGVCAPANVSICFYVNASGLTGVSADRLLEKATWLTEASQSDLAEQMWRRVKQALPSVIWFLLSCAP